MIYNSFTKKDYEFYKPSHRLDKSLDLTNLDIAKVVVVVFLVGLVVSYLF